MRALERQRRSEDVVEAINIWKYNGELSEKSCDCMQELIEWLSKHMHSNEGLPPLTSLSKQRPRIMTWEMYHENTTAGDKLTMYLCLDYIYRHYVREQGETDVEMCNRVDSLWSASMLIDNQDRKLLRIIKTDAMDFYDTPQSEEDISAHSAHPLGWRHRVRRSGNAQYYGLMIREIKESAAKAFLVGEQQSLVIDSGATGNFVPVGVKLTNTRPANKIVQGAGGDVMRGLVVGVCTAAGHTIQMAHKRRSVVVHCSSRPLLWSIFSRQKCRARRESKSSVSGATRTQGK